VSAVATREREGVATERPQRAEASQRLFDDGLTLEDKVLGAWEDLIVEGRAACPVCGGSMAAGSPCEGCGSELS
jgi:hypothetical protein